MIVVAAVDGSEATRAVLQQALERAGGDAGEVHVVHVYTVPPAVYLAAGQAMIDLDALAAADHSEVSEVVNRAMLATETPWRFVELVGPAASTIVSYAAEVGADLIVTGTRGRGELVSLLLGSTSHGIIHDSPCEVLVVPTAAVGADSAELLKPGPH